MGFPTKYKFGCLSCLNENHYWNKKNYSLTVRCVWARIPVAPFSPQISLYFILSSLQKGVIRHIWGLELRRTEHVVDRGSYILCACVCAQLLSHVWLCNSMDCSPPGSSVHGILQARIWSGLPFTTPRDLPQPGIEPMPLGSPAFASGLFITEPPREPLHIVDA